jgi:hypothetical protein
MVSFVAGAFVGTFGGMASWLIMAAWLEAKRLRLQGAQGAVEESVVCTWSATLGVGGIIVSSRPKCDVSQIIKARLAIGASQPPGRLGKLYTG